jgi:hypothetical protein
MLHAGNFKCKAAPAWWQILLSMVQVHALNEVVRQLEAREQCVNSGTKTQEIGKGHDIV